jgi:hypothetical protein
VRLKGKEPKLQAVYKTWQRNGALIKCTFPFQVNGIWKLMRKKVKVRYRNPITGVDRP